MFFCEICAPGNCKTPNVFVKVNLLSFREILFNFSVIFKPKLFYEIAVLYPRT